MERWTGSAAATPPVASGGLVRDISTGKISVGSTRCVLIDTIICVGYLCCVICVALYVLVICVGYLCCVICVALYVLRYMCWLYVLVICVALYALRYMC
jgi:hypothetical protein